MDQLPERYLPDRIEQLRRAIEKAEQSLERLDEIKSTLIRLLSECEQNLEDILRMGGSPEVADLAQRSLDKLKEIKVLLGKVTKEKAEMQDVRRQMKAAKAIFEIEHSEQITSRLEEIE